MLPGLVFNACHITGAELLRLCEAHGHEVRKPPKDLTRAECCSVLGAREIRVGTEKNKLKDLRDRVAKLYEDEDINGVKRLKDPRGLSLYVNLVNAGKISSPVPAKDQPDDASPLWITKLFVIARDAPSISMDVIRHWFR